MNFQRMFRLRLALCRLVNLSIAGAPILLKGNGAFVGEDYVVKSVATFHHAPRVASQFDRRSFRSKPIVSSIEDKSQFDRRVNDYKNYSFASV